MSALGGRATEAKNAREHNVGVVTLVKVGVLRGDLFGHVRHWQVSRREVSGCVEGYGVFSNLLKPMISSLAGALGLPLSLIKKRNDVSDRLEPGGTLCSFPSSVRG
jgi:hypothetical protein